MLATTARLSWPSLAETGRWAGRPADAGAARCCTGLLLAPGLALAATGVAWAAVAAARCTLACSAWFSCRSASTSCRRASSSCWEAL